MANAAYQAGVAIVAGDTKVVERGQRRWRVHQHQWPGLAALRPAMSGSQAQPGDAILLSGPVGDHGLAVLSQRQGLQFDSPSCQTAHRCIHWPQP